MNTDQILTAKGNPGTLARLAAHYGRLAKRQAPGRQLQAGVFAADKELHFEFASEAKPARFHAASVGKLFTAVLVHRLVATGQLRLDQSIAELLDLSVTAGLFTSGPEAVTLQMLLEHTSGVADYFGEQILADPQKRWTVPELLDFTRENFQPVGEPGAQFHYSDTGYVLLGLIVERVSGRPFHEQMRREIFEPLGMADTSLFGFGEPSGVPSEVPSGVTSNASADPLAPLWVDGKEFSTAPALSCDWAGGGVVSSVNDLLTFSRALHEPSTLEPGGNPLVPPAAYELMFHRGPALHRGIRYGTGGVRIVWRELFFLLAGRPDLLGGLGITAATVLYDPRNNIHLVQNFGDSAAVSTAFNSLAKVVPMVTRF